MSQSDAPGLTDADDRELADIAEHGYPNYGENLTPEGRRRGGEARAESICPRCHNDLNGATACDFCRPSPSSPGFENGDAAAREFLHRCGGDP